MSLCRRTFFVLALPLLRTTTLPAQSVTDSGLVFTRAQVTARITDLQRIHTPEGIESLESIPVNGTTQWISIRGLNRANPVLLVLHGGPGAPMMPSSWAYQKPWEDFFTVVNWDQRGVGKSFSAADSARLGASLTNDQLITDAAVVVEHVRKRLGKDKIVLMGFSWGSIIGPYLVRRHPEWFAAYVGVGQSADDGEVTLFRRLTQLAERSGNDTAVKELRALAPYPDPIKPPTIEQALAVRKWARYFDGGWYGKRDFDLWFSLTQWSPEYTDADVTHFLPAVAWAGRHMVGGDPKLWDKQPTALPVPVVILQGRHDLHTPWDAARKYFEAITSPRKRFVTFERSAHYPMFEEPGRFLMTLVTEVRPLAGPPTAFSREP